MLSLSYGLWFMFNTMSYYESFPMTAMTYPSSLLLVLILA